MADVATVRIADYINARGIKISAISRGTGIPDGILRRSLSERSRDLRAEEFLKVCSFIGAQPSEFRDSDSENSCII